MQSTVKYSGTPPYDHPVNTTTSLLRSPYSGPKKAQSVIFLFLNTATPLIRPVFHGPKAVVLSGFHCITIQEDSSLMIGNYKITRKNPKRGASKNKKKTRDRVDSEDQYGRWKLRLMGSCCHAFSSFPKPLPSLNPRCQFFNKNAHKRTMK